ncbi:MAG: hypothetical protein FJ109_14015 [Deltaproteobacteria bacterium]|nr:hypothetical protein [Deltaproteobacteria bacterium]
MLRRSLLALLLVSVFGLLAACASCSSTPTFPGDTKEVCTGDACPDDVIDDHREGGGDFETVDVPDKDEEKPDEVAPPDEVGPCKDDCKEGEIKCTSDKKYVECKQDGDCWVWAVQPVTCKAENDVCLCKTIEGGGDVCTPAEGEKGCTCPPQCDGKECGSDGCGGECGTCEAPAVCGIETFKCEECKEDQCAEGETWCNGPKVQHCVNANVDTPEEPACWVFGPAEDCPAYETCVGFDCICDFKGCGEEGDLVCCPGNEYTCFGGECCLPSCDTEGGKKECGSDGCGGSCGECPQEKPFCSAEFVCEAECASDCNVEGESACQGVAGYKKCTKVPNTADCLQYKLFGCAAGTKCNPDKGVCECQPKCSGKECGSDGCGGECGKCPAGVGWECTQDQKCACPCTGIPFNPVCDTKSETTYENGCKAECAGVPEGNIAKGKCPTCEEKCTADEKKLQEICGSDGVDYFSFCELKCAIGTKDCLSLQKCPQVKYPGLCQLDCCKDKGCPKDYNPICGTDGETYCNMCTLLLCPGAGNPDYACVGECLDATKCPDCTDDCAPVCGKLGIKRKTYGNECLMKCAGAEFKWEGDCCLECPEVDAYVCSSDFNVFKSECFLLCMAPDETPALYDIPKLPDGSYWTDVCDVCMCDLGSGPAVCGSDYQTYANQCALQCASDAAPGEVDPNPLCEGECTVESCPCPPKTGGYPVESELAWGFVGDDGRRGVCGADGYTYGNECAAAYAKTTVVAQTWCEKCQDECAGTPYEPVCCKDSVTYPNSCVPQKCNNKLDVAQCAKGKCCLVDVDCDDGKPATADTCKPTGVCENL